MSESQPKRKPLKKVARPTFIDPNQRYSMQEAHAALGQSHMKTYADIREGKLLTILDGRRRYVPGAEIIRRSSATSPVSPITDASIGKVK